MDGWWKERWIGKRKDGMRMMRGRGLMGCFYGGKGGLIMEGRERRVEGFW